LLLDLFVEVQDVLCQPIYEFHVSFLPCCDCNVSSKKGESRFTEELFNIFSMRGSEGAPRGRVTHVSSRRVEMGEVEGRRIEDAA